jgi:hypothetical protein
MREYQPRADPGFASKAGGAQDASVRSPCGLLDSRFWPSHPRPGIRPGPGLDVGESGVLVWLSALIPPFLLTYYRGWMGASLALAAGMAALALGNVAAMVTLGIAIPEDPRWSSGWS